MNIEKAGAAGLLVLAAVLLGVSAAAVAQVLSSIAALARGGGTITLETLPLLALAAGSLGAGAYLTSHAIRALFGERADDVTAVLPLLCFLALVLQFILGQLAWRNLRWAMPSAYLGAVCIFETVDSVQTNRFTAGTTDEGYYETTGSFQWIVSEASEFDRSIIEQMKKKGPCVRIEFVPYPWWQVAVADGFAHERPKGIEFIMFALKTWGASCMDAILLGLTWYWFWIGGALIVAFAAVRPWKSTRVII